VPHGFHSPTTLEQAGYRFDRTGFERFYAATDDPWKFESDRELRKYAELLRACGDGPFGRALEIGCAIGVFTEMLAPRCTDLLAADISGIAVARARARVSRYGHVRCERRTLPAEMPQESFDLMVASDVLYYWPLPVVTGAAPMFEVYLAPGGRLVLLHWRRRPDATLSGDEVHETLAAELGGLTHVEGREVLESRLDIFVREVTASTERRSRAIAAP
jgi:SAM-dependent methyltransferase